jgi:hypothetical protein
VEYRVVLSVVLLVFTNTFDVVANEPGYFRELNRYGMELEPGDIVILKQRQLHNVIHLLQRIPLNDRSIWIHSDDNVRLRPIVLGAVSVSDGRQCCDWFAYIRAYCYPKNIIAEKLGDPFACLEVLNRPISGLFYNSDAELRIAQLKSTLVEAVAQKENLFLCVGTSVATDGAILWHGASSSKLAEDVRLQLLEGTAPIVGPVYPESNRISRPGQRFLSEITGRLVIGARFRRLKLITYSVSPRIDFAFGEDVVLMSEQWNK